MLALLQVCDGGVRQTEFFSGVIALFFVSDGVITVVVCGKPEGTTGHQKQDCHNKENFVHTITQRIFASVMNLSDMLNPPF
ncbi:TPA: hypothetical protein U0D20_004877, partial [Escherichia coli]|nr:hypothetical protein [Escherichia coli]